ncbi:hypothetical protein AAG570_012614 [Ranatra chinensis]|uniref:Uncharacterized protein n=1 Tax=Ranatra chinensis TaxID=642074 RepID=A0ABD0YEZ6_9HEMI
MVFRATWRSGSRRLPKPEPTWKQLTRVFQRSPNQFGISTRAIEYELRFLEKLVKEAVQMELPDMSRGHVRTLDENASFEVVLARIDEEEDNYQASKEGRNLGWNTVERRRDRREVQREARKKPPPPPPLQPQSPQKNTNGGQRRECLKGASYICSARARPCTGGTNEGRPTVSNQIGWRRMQSNILRGHGFSDSDGKHPHILLRHRPGGNSQGSQRGSQQFQWPR